MSILDLNPMRCTASCSSTLQTERRGDGELCIKMTQTATRVGSIWIQTTHLGEILAPEKHDELHGRLDDDDGHPRRRHEFAQVLTLLKLHARVVDSRHHALRL